MVYIMGTPPNRIELKAPEARKLDKMLQEASLLAAFS
jgi:hypothetical protein